MEELEFEPIESPEYIEFCEDNNRGYRHGISKCGKWMRQKCFHSGDLSNKNHYFVVMSTYDPFTSQVVEIKPYRISSVDGTYKSASQQVNDFLNSMKHGLMMPDGKFQEIQAPMFGVQYNKPEICDDGRCKCDCSTPCPLGKSGIAYRCTKQELDEHYNKSL